MSATFQPVRGPGDARPIVRCTCENMSCPACRLALNLNERNAQDLLEHVGLQATLVGIEPAAKIATLCTARLAMYDTESEVPAIEANRVYVGGRSAERMREYTEQLLTIARAAGDGWVGWA